MLTMMDSSADGWDKAYWTWKNGDVGGAGSGNVLASGTLEDGATATAQLCAYTRVSCYDFIVSNGLYPSEVSWTIEAKCASPLDLASERTCSRACSQAACTC